ncbi:MAG: radical SAM protein [Spirochaetales bacterium]|nr:radical SAM protein [Spirochaetales bacterium]
MNFFAHHKVSFVDYPKKISTLLFVSGCNLNCAYCHNASLKKRRLNKITERSVFEFITKRQNLIDAVVITGGEPSLYRDEIRDFFIRLSAAFPTLLKKVDTNGTSPGFIKDISAYSDLISMDFKTLFYEKYLNFPMDVILNSIEELKKTENYEIRITMYPEYISPEDFPEIGKILRGAQNVVIQQYRQVDNVKPYKDKVLNDFSNILKSYAENVYLKL